MLALPVSYFPLTTHSRMANSSKRSRSQHVEGWPGRPEAPVERCVGEWAGGRVGGWVLKCCQMKSHYLSGLGKNESGVALTSRAAWPKNTSHRLGERDSGSEIHFAAFRNPEMVQSRKMPTNGKTEPYGFNHGFQVARIGFRKIYCGCHSLTPSLPHSAVLLSGQPSTPVPLRPCAGTRSH